MSLKSVLCYCVLGITLCIFMVSSTFGQEAADEDTTPAPPSLRPRCFRYTWLGPTFTNTSSFLNSTCDDVTHLEEGRPCSEPLVVSHDGTWPDTNYIWDNHHDVATCVLDDTDVCASWTEYFNGYVERVHYMCTRVTTDTGGVVTSGCYDVQDGAAMRRLCVCRSVSGALPCNGAGALGASLGLLAGLAAALLVLVAGA